MGQKLTMIVLKNLGLGFEEKVNQQFIDDSTRVDRTGLAGFPGFPAVTLTMTHFPTSLKFKPWIMQGIIQKCIGSGRELGKSFRYAARDIRSFHVLSVFPPDTFI
jgi:hypothetical protein